MFHDRCCSGRVKRTIKQVWCSAVMHLGDSSAARSVSGESHFWLSGTIRKAMALYSWGGMMISFFSLLHQKKEHKWFTQKHVLLEAILMLCSAI